MQSAIAIERPLEAHHQDILRNVFDVLLESIFLCGCTYHADTYLLQWKQPGRFGAQPDESLIKHFSIWELENHPLTKEWEEYRDVTTTRKSLLSVSKAVRFEWAPIFWRTTTIHVGDPRPARPDFLDHVSPRRFEETFLSKIERPLLSCVRRLVYYPASDRVNLALGYLTDSMNDSPYMGHFSGIQELGQVVSRYPALSNLDKLSVFFRPQPQEPLPEYITRMFGNAPTSAYRQRWGLMDSNQDWQGFARAMVTGVLNGFGVEREMGIENPAGAGNRAVIWWKLKIERV